MYGAVPWCGEMMSTMKSGAVTQCSTFSHLFQLWSSSSLSITGTVSDRRMLAGLCVCVCVCVCVCACVCVCQCKKMLQ